MMVPVPHVSSSAAAPSGWAVLTRWWAAVGGDGLYTLTLHWRPVPPHLAHGVILKYLVSPASVCMYVHILAPNSEMNVLQYKFFFLCVTCDDPPQITVRESDTGLVHNVTVLGDLTNLTLPNVTSSRVEVTLTASTVKGAGPPSPPARLNLLLTHLKVRRGPHSLVCTGQVSS